jgi:hypothetical protein
MLSVFGVAPSDLISSGKVVAEFPSFSGQTVGGVVPVDYPTVVLELSSSAGKSSEHWPWRPTNRGYVVLLNEQPGSALKNQLRKIRYLQDEFGQNRVWPWFDPRYLKLALNSLEGSELSFMFGPIQAFGFVANDNADNIHAIELYQLGLDGLLVKKVAA